LKGKLDVYGVAWSGDRASYQAFVDKYQLSFPQAIDDAGELFTQFGVPAQPAWVFVTRDGKATRHLGALEPNELTKALNTLTT
jgi:peroxiredoxin